MPPVYLEKHKARWPLVKQLLSLSLSASTVANALGLSEATIRKDITQHGSLLILFPDRPSMADRYATIFKRFAQLRVDPGRKSDQFKTDEYNALYSWLDFDSLPSFLSGLLCMGRKMAFPRIHPEQAPYLNLMSQVLDYGSSDLDTDKILDSFCQRVVDGDQDAPGAAEQLSDPLLVHADHYLELEGRLCLIWPINAQELVDQALDKLTPREALILRRHYGIRQEEMESLRQIAEELQVTAPRIKVLEDKALRKLRRLAKKPPLCFLGTAPTTEEILAQEDRINTIALREGELLTEITRLQEALAGRVSAHEDVTGIQDPENSVSTKALLSLLVRTPMDEFKMSVRAANCIHNANITNLLDLVFRSEAEMLRVRNFGRKSLFELKELLAGFSGKCGVRLHFDMKLPADLVKALRMRGLMATLLPKPVIYRQYPELNRTKPSQGVFTQRQIDLLKAARIRCWGDLLPLREGQLLEVVPDFTHRDIDDILTLLDQAKSRNQELNYPVKLNFSIGLGMGPTPDWIKEYLRQPS
jgi:hypothetical protein